jgi:putative lipoic acid-binding regulatory protein
MAKKESPVKNEQQHLFAFPCDFPIKIMGKPDADLEKFVHDALHKHVQNPASITLKTRQSKDANYISITAVFEAHSKDQLDTLYRLFTAHPAVKMVL